MSMVWGVVEVRPRMVVVVVVVIAVLSELMLDYNIKACPRPF
jgi:hypothetical protein